MRGIGFPPAVTNSPPDHTSISRLMKLITPSGARSLLSIRPAAALLAAATLTVACNRSAAPSVAEGRALYLANGCASCHGSSGLGDGPIGKTLNPRPRDFRDSAAFRNGTDVASIARTIASGIPMGGAMPLFAHLTDGERRDLAAYLISLRSQSPNGRTSP